MERAVHPNSPQVIKSIVTKVGSAMRPFFNRQPASTWKWYARANGKSRLLKASTWRECWWEVSFSAHWLILLEEEQL